MDTTVTTITTVTAVTAVTVDYTKKDTEDMNDVNEAMEIGTGTLLGGSLSVLNTGMGDIHITFDKDDPAEREKAVQMLLDMQKRGYAILVEQPDGSYARAHAIDGERSEYRIFLPGEPVPGEPAPEPKRRGAGRTPRKLQETRLPVTGTRAIGVARSAGG